MLHRSGYGEETMRVDVEFDFGAASWQEVRLTGRWYIVSDLYQDTQTVMCEISYGALSGSYFTFNGLDRWEITKGTRFVREDKLRITLIGDIQGVEYDEVS